MIKVTKKIISYSVILAVLLTGFFGFLVDSLAATGSFGISPPYVTNEHLIPGAHFEQTIYLVQDKPLSGSKARVEIDAPEIEDWITIDKGLAFPFPDGEKKVPVTIIVDVPKDTEYGNYRGFITFKRIPPSESSGGGVSTILGVRADLNLVVTEAGFADFKVKGISVSTIEKGDPLAVLLMVENTGNVPTGPNKVHVDIYNIAYNDLLASDDITDLGWVEPFKTQQIKGEMSVDLDLGEYWADVSVYKEGESSGVYRIHFLVVPEGTLKKEEEREEKPGIFLSELWKILLFAAFVIIIGLISINWEKLATFFKKGKKSKKKKKRKKK